MKLTTDYAERVYAGVLGKLVGVYLGRPFEQWRHADIVARLGEVHYYVHERLGVPLVVTDDDISGTFTFVRALEDYAHKGKEITARDVGQTWLNYIIENRTILWWGGMGMSTEHTAFLRLKRGVEAPRSGSIELNSRVVAEQIGAQIFIDGWAMVAPGDPELAASLARRAASVSHDGEAIYGAQVVAAIESQAFVERDLNKLLDTAVGFIPKDSTIYRMIADLRELRANESNWHTGLARIHDRYSYEKWPGGCHMVPNHAVILLGLLWGEDANPAVAFQRSLMITNTAGYDTDCNSGNVGCIQGLRFGLPALDDGPDWRGPVADRMLLPTADGGRCVTDAATEATRLANLGRALAGRPPLAPKNGARFHFELPGSVQGFVAEDSPECRGVLTISNPDGHALALTYNRLAPGRFARAATQTFVTPAQAKMGGYGVYASPTLHPGQTVVASIAAAADDSPAPVRARLYVRHFNGKDDLERAYGPAVELQSADELRWTIPDLDGQPIAEIGVELSCDAPTSGTAHLNFLTWSGVPNTVLKKPAAGGTMWTKAWVDGMSQRHGGDRWVQNEGRGLLICGTREWTDYRVSADVTIHMAKAAGLAARVQGMRRFYALLLCDDQTVRLVKALDGDTVLAQKPCAWEFTKPRPLALEVKGNRIRGWVNDELVADVTDADHPLTGGAVGIVCEEGRGTNGPVTIRPA